MEYYTVPQQDFKINVICNFLIFISSVCTSDLKNCLRYTISLFYILCWVYEMKMEDLMIL